MRNEWMGNNNRGLAIIRISSGRQKSGVSHEVQEKEVREYCEFNGIDLQRVVKMIESAQDSDDRKKYAQALSEALAQDIRHLLFYMYDRETRNLIDVEKNEKLVTADLLCLHYVRDNKVLYQGSSDSDFFIRDVQAVTNKHFIRNLRAKVNDAMKQKAESGWYPSNSVPLGYALKKAHDEKGRELRRGSTVVRDPNERNVAQVLREFELRAMGYSYEQICERITAENLIDSEKIKYYRKCTVEKRINNSFYEGRFTWQGVEYEGKHEVIVPADLIRRARQVRRGLQLVRTEDRLGVFSGGWITCALCGCNIVYDPKRKVNRRTGAETTFHYYHCTNGRRAHDKQINVSEGALWIQFDTAVDAITIGPDLAARIADALNETHRKAIAAGTREIEEHRRTLQDLERREDRAYEDMVAGNLDPEGFRRQVQRIRADRGKLTNLIQQAQAAQNGNYRETARSILELCKNAKSLFLSRSPLERRNFLERILSNPKLESQTLRFDLKKPFSTLAVINESEEWRAHIDDLRTEFAALHGRKP